MVHLRSIILLSLLLTAPNAALACTCFASAPFIQLVELGNADYLIRARVEGHDAAIAAYPNSMTVTVLEELKGEVAAESLTVFGSDGMSCSPSVSRYAAGKEWLIPMSYFNGRFIISPCAPVILVQYQGPLELAPPRSYSLNKASFQGCQNLSRADYLIFNRAKMALEDFRVESVFYANVLA